MSTTSAGAPVADGTLRCYRHPERETLLRCGRCERPICLACQVRHPVGVRCPECAPVRSTGAVNARLAARQSPVTWALLALIVLVWGAMEAFGSSTDSATLLLFGAKANWRIDDGEVWRLFTAMFLHIGIWHLAMNAFSLYNMGGLLEPLLGWRRYLALYLLSGLCGSFASYLFNPRSISAGASGAIFGIIGGVLAFFFLHRKVFGEASRRMLVNVGFIVLLNLAFGLRAGGIDNWAHMGGLAGGIVLGAILAPRYGGIFLDRPQLFARDASGWRPWLFTLLFGLALAAAVASALQHNANSAQSLLSRAEALYEADRGADAAPLLERAVAQDPRLWEAHYYLGVIALDAGDARSAIASLETAARLEPGEPFTQYLLGAAYQSAGRFAEARAAYQRAMDNAAGSRGNLSGRAAEALRRLEGR